MEKFPFDLDRISELHLYCTLNTHCRSTVTCYFKSHYTLTCRRVHDLTYVVRTSQMWK